MEVSVEEVDSSEIKLQRVRPLILAHHTHTGRAAAAYQLLGLRPRLSVQSRTKAAQPSALSCTEKHSLPRKVNHVNQHSRVLGCCMTCLVPCILKARVTCHVPRVFSRTEQVKQLFPRGGSEMTAVHSGEEFLWKDYAPMVFRFVCVCLCVHVCACVGLCVDLCA